MNNWSIVFFFPEHNTPTANSITTKITITTKAITNKTNRGNMQKREQMKRKHFQDISPRQVEKKEKNTKRGKPVSRYLSPPGNSWAAAGGLRSLLDSILQISIVNMCLHILCQSTPIFSILCNFYLAHTYSYGNQMKNQQVSFCAIKIERS